MDSIRIKRNYLVRGVTDEVALLIPEKSWHYLRAMIDQRAGFRALQQSLASVLVGVVISDVFFLASAFVQGYRSDLPEWVWPAAWIIGTVSATGALLLFLSARISAEMRARSNEELLEFMDNLVSRKDQAPQKLEPSFSGVTLGKRRHDGAKGDARPHVPLVEAPRAEMRHTGIRIGDQVVHAQFGEGVVKEISEAGVKIEFEFVGPKVLFPVQHDQEMEGVSSNDQV